jgi:peptidoglycan/xylan/chitin deacetylase (PgdA/CDA1 family)
VLLAHHMTAAFYIITGRFHEAGFVDEAQVRQLDAAGMDVGAHTRHHLDLPSLGAAQLQDEVAGSRQDLERVLHHPIASFAYPAGAYDAAAIDAVRRAGFAIALTTNPGAEASSLHPFELPRIRVGRDTTPAQLLACVAGGYGCG